MSDIHSKEIRSFNMKQIKSKNTKPEILIRKFLYKNGFRYRLHVKSLFGRPDIVLRKYNLVIFINGCFWHSHENCEKFALPKTRTDWWCKKLARNKENDNQNILKLKQEGWRVLVIWECSLKPKYKQETLKNLLTQILNMGISLGGDLKANIL